MCSSRVDPTLILKAFLMGADGVLVAGCHLGDCHYVNGNYNTEKRIMKTMKALEYVGLEAKRLRLEWISASEGPKFARVVREFTEEIKQFGPNSMKNM